MAPTFDRSHWLNCDNYADTPEGLKRCAATTYEREQHLWDMMDANITDLFSQIEDGYYDPEWVDKAFYGKHEGPVIICGAGPSLLSDMDKIKHQYEENDCPIIAVDRSFRTLKENGIKPWLTVSVDPQMSVWNFYRDCVEEGDNIALNAVCDTSVFNEVASNGANIFLFGSLQPFSPFWDLARQEYGEHIATTRPGCIVTYSAVDIAVWAGFNPIVTIGNELCFDPAKDGELIKNYAENGGFIFHSCDDGRLTIPPFMDAAHAFSFFPQWHPDIYFVEASGGLERGWLKELS